MWVPDGPDEVLERLHARYARPRRLVPTPHGVFLLGPAPEVEAEVPDALKVAAGRGRSAVGFSWEGDRARAHAWLNRRLVSGAFENPDVLLAVAAALGIDGLTARRAAEETTGVGIGQWIGFLERAGFTAEGRALRWIAESDVDVPAHRRRWWELAGERSTTLVEPGSRPYSPTVLVLCLVLFTTALIGGGALVWAERDHPMVLLGCAALLATAGALSQLVVLAPLAVSRSRRTDPFPVSDPLDLRAHLTAPPAPDPTPAIARYEAEPDYLRGGS
ncbi:hypothetical protein APASM_2486 [Actinosynnema pretiosum subsp. pretiosum]|nr:hypothetical protein APASM_2486 [Actinosynnema pretiosum subsp. pretiosum]